MAAEKAAEDYGMWKALLRWSLEQQSPEGNRVDPMTDEKRIFLEKVMSEMTVDLAKKMAQLLENADKVEALSELEDIVENLDSARDFCRLGGIARILEVIKQSEERSVINAAAGIIGTAAQNDQYVQSHVLENDGLHILENAFQPQESSRILTAISSLGVLPRAELLHHALSQGDAKTKAKAAFLVTKSPDISFDVVADALKAAKEDPENIALRIHTISALSTKARADPKAFEARFSPAALKAILSTEVTGPEEETPAPSFFCVFQS